MNFEQDGITMNLNNSMAVAATPPAVAHPATAYPASAYPARPIILTDEQQTAVAAIERAITDRQNFTLHGLAGTGKTTVAAHIARSRPGALLCALTGKAASVLRDKTGVDAATVHSTFYYFVRSVEKEGKPSRLEFRPAHGPGALKGNVLLLDEVSMIDRRMAADILATGITVVAIGDPGQLPPVNGDPFFTSASLTLQKIHRQALDSPIIRQAHAVRQCGESQRGGEYTSDGAAFRVIARATADDLDSADVVLVWRRATHSRLNALCRRAAGITALLPQKGEPLVCLRNTPHYGLYNGAIYRASRELYETDPTVGITTDAGDLEVYADFALPGAEDEPLNLPPGGWKTAFAFGYAMTVHKAQGSEFDTVLLIDENHSADRIPWLYTGITRARNSITIAKGTVL